MTRRDWWFGVLVICACLLANAVVPRYDLRHAVGGESIDYIRYDRWTGHAEWGQFQKRGTWRGRWASVSSADAWFKAHTARVEDILDVEPPPAGR